MSRVLDYLKRYPLQVFYLLTFFISWGAVLLLIGGPTAIPGMPEETQKLLPLGVMAMLMGPSISGMLMIWVVEGESGRRNFRQRLLRWKVRAYWYAVALLTAPTVMIVSMLALSVINSEYLPSITSSPERSSLLMMGISYGLAAGVLEEIGWTGFVLPLMRSRYGLPATGLIMGFLWGAWHLIVNFWGSGDANGLLATDLLLPALFWSVVILPAYRVLMVWVHDNTGSLLVAMLMHMSLTACMITLNPLDPDLQLVYVVTFGSLLVLFAVIACVKAGRQAHQAPVGPEI
jgi:membrane protease YdiL (CAAX protease family)